MQPHNHSALTDQQQLFFGAHHAQACQRIAITAELDATQAQAGAALQGFGREEIALRAGATWHPIPNVDVVFTFELPVYQDVNELQPETDFRLIAGFGYRF